LWTIPPGFSLGEELLHSNQLYGREVGQDTHPISLPVAVIEMAQVRTGEFGTGEAVFMATCGQLSAVLDRAIDAGI
jgi:hypothetical protein